MNNPHLQNDGSGNNIVHIAPDTKHHHIPGYKKDFGKKLYNQIIEYQQSMKTIVAVVVVLNILLLLGLFAGIIIAINNGNNIKANTELLRDIKDNLPPPHQFTK